MDRVDAFIAAHVHDWRLGLAALGVFVFIAMLMGLWHPNKHHYDSKPNQPL